MMRPTESWLETVPIKISCYHHCWLASSPSEHSVKAELRKKKQNKSLQLSDTKKNIWRIKVFCVLTTTTKPKSSLFTINIVRITDTYKQNSTHLWVRHGSCNEADKEHVLPFEVSKDGFLHHQNLLVIVRIVCYKNGLL